MTIRRFGNVTIRLHEVKTTFELNFLIVELTNYQID